MGCWYILKTWVQEILVDEFITEDLPFNEINKAFQLLLSGQGLRTALHF
jgi:S-(hydroxymethyl)glutathione dehydrogenase/alcohol dehydrogenase